jgi:hypothetical protein
MVCVKHYTCTSEKYQGARNTMKTPRISIGAFAVFCIAALVIGTSGAAAMPQGATDNLKEGTQQHSAMWNEG